MRLLRRLALSIALAAGVVAPGACGAAEPTTEDLARELFALTFEGAIAQFNVQAVENIWPDVQAALVAKNPNLDAATLAALRQDFERIRLAHLREMMKDVPNIYLRHLTAQEMRDLIVFYRTPTGSKLLTVLPKIMAEGFATVLPRLQALAADTQETFLTLLRERGYLK
jgi:hypothetical protein